LAHLIGSISSHNPVGSIAPLDSASDGASDTAGSSSTALCKIVTISSCGSACLDILPSTPLSTKLLRRESLLSEEMRENQQNPPDCSCSLQVEQLECDASDNERQYIRVSQDQHGVGSYEFRFHSVLAQLEEAVPQPSSATCASAVMAQSLSLPLITPRDAASAAVPENTPFVFSTLHLQSPKQVVVFACARGGGGGALLGGESETMTLVPRCKKMVFFTTMNLHMN
jgi:hypothetical protein